MKSLFSQTDKQTLRAFWAATHRHKKELMLTGLMVISTISINIAAPFATSQILAGLVRPEIDLSPYFVMLLAASVTGYISNRIGFKALMRMAAKTSNDLQIRAYEMLLRRSSGFHANNVSGKLVSDAVDYPRAYLQIQNSLLIEVMPFVVIIVVGVGIIIFSSLMLGLIMIAMTLLIVGWAWLQSLSRLEVRSQRKQAQRELTAQVGDTISNILAVKSFAHEERELTTAGKLSRALLQLRQRDWTDVAVDGSNRHGALLIIQFVFVVYLVYATRQNPELLGVGIFAFTYSINMTNRLFQINTFIRNIEEGLLEAAPITEYLAEQTEIVDPKNAADISVSRAAVSFNNVSFYYPDNQQESKVLDGFNLKIKPGERVGLVGPSGGGKSTLMKLLLRFEDVSQGNITIDNQNIAEVTQASLRKSIAYVPQEPLLFHRTIAENIAYGAETVDIRAVKEATKLAYAFDFINELPSKFDTVVGERGVKLSGGQRQRIAIARAILKDAPILLLDEATSALDSESEKYIQSALHKLMQNKTVVVIAHRLSTINELDRIVVIDEGKIIEEGTHKKLLQNKSLYAKLWSHQSGGFLEE